MLKNLNYLMNKSGTLKWKIIIHKSYILLKLVSDANFPNL